MIRPAWLAALLVVACTAAAQPAPIGEPVTDEVVRDAEFGVSARHFGLERRVEMYQWRKLGPGYAKVWSTSPIDSRAYAKGYQNPPELALRSRRWLARRVRIDGSPLDATVLERLGEWRTFRPGFSALPGNLAATFQPEGDGLGSALNPLEPQIGDLRIHWRELTLPPLQGRIGLHEGRWVLASEAAAPAPARVEAPAGRHYGLPIGIGALVVLLALALQRRQHRRKRL
jgi:hypothetical protein